MPDDNNSGAPAGDQGNQGAQGATGSQGGAQNEPLGDAGKRALEEERSGRKAAEKAARDAQAELDKLRKDSMSDQERAVAEAKAEARAEVLTQANQRLLRAEVRAAAAGKLADPDDALGLLDLPSFMDDDGEINTKAIKSAIDKLVSSKPYLSARPGNGSGEGGARGGNANTEPSMDDWLRAKAGR